MKRPIDLISVAWGIAIAGTYLALQCQMWTSFGIALIMAIILWLALVTREKQQQKFDLNKAKFSIGESVIIDGFPGMASSVYGTILCRQTDGDTYLVAFEQADKPRWELRIVREVPERMIRKTSVPRSFWYDAPNPPEKV